MRFRRRPMTKTRMMEGPRSKFFVSSFYLLHYIIDFLVPTGPFLTLFLKFMSYAIYLFQVYFIFLFFENHPT